MANKIRSIELDGGVVANFIDGGKIEIVQNKKKVTIHVSDLETIRDIAMNNGEVEAGGNGQIITNKEKVS